MYFKEFGFYKVNFDYVKFLNSKDEQVFFSDKKGYESKPYIGYLINIDNIHYCIPLTSAKKKHLSWKNVSIKNILIYENKPEKIDGFSGVSKKMKNGEYKYIYSVLCLEKMIPVDPSLCEYIDFEKTTGAYKSLLEKEYSFLKSKKQLVLSKAAKLYNKQKKTKIVEETACDFCILEKAYFEYKKDSIK